MITNTLRLLNLPEDIRQLITEGKLSAGHGRMLAGIEDEQQMRALVAQILSETLSVRAVEKIVSEMKGDVSDKKEKSEKKPEKQEIELIHLKEEIQRKLGTKANIAGTSKKGKIEIFYYSLQDLERIARELNFSI